MLSKGLDMTEESNYENALYMEEEDDTPYMSNRLIIPGVHLYFTDIAREIVEQKRINTIPLMREYHLSETDLQQVIKELQDAGILDSEQNATMCMQELERFLDIYEPSLFECKHTAFDREIFFVLAKLYSKKALKTHIHVFLQKKL